MCSSAEPTMDDSASPAVSTVSSDTPYSATTSPNFLPALSTSPRTSSTSRVPDTAAEPNSERPKRAPSSSAQSTTLTETGRSTPSRCSARRISAPASTPRQPSSQPPLGTESRWLPSTIRSGRLPRRVTHRFPAGSVVVSTGMPSKVERNHSRALAHGSVHARRALPSGGPSDGRPPTVWGMPSTGWELSKRSSRRSATTRRGSAGMVIVLPRERRVCWDRRPGSAGGEQREQGK
ncbi:unannotated protein [freshwater metagenome]|uniref:Unannotated protein n=1 Tax=freshwater metagenome TaxID=449393 RepID=A0A6J7DRS4_9ZZZZ